MKTYPSPQKNKIHLLQSYTIVAGRFSLVLIGCLVLIQAQSQVDKRLALADRYFAAGEYFTAAGLYDQFLHPAAQTKVRSEFPLTTRRSSEGKIGSYSSKTDIVFKQAESYRLANYWTKASELYNECYKNDSAKYTDALYWYSVCQRSIGNYSTAEESIDRFLNSSDKNNSQYQSALKEKQTLQFIRSQINRPDSVLYHTQKINMPFVNGKGVFAPVAVTGKQLMFTSTETDSVAEGTNPYHNRLFRSALSTDGLENPEPLIIESIDPSFNQGAACISANGNHLYLTQWKKEKGQFISSIYYSTKTSTGWSAPEVLPFVNQQGYNSKQPFCSADGRYLFFASDKKGGKGGFDIWYAALKEDGTTEEPVNAGAVINTQANEQAPFYHNSTGTLVFASDRTPGMGGYDLYQAKGSPVVWRTPENMGYPINSSRDDVYFFAAENSNLLKNAMVSSDRGSECCLATYAITKTPKKKMIAGMVVDCAFNIPLADAEVILKDAEGAIIKSITDTNGKYSFEITDNSNQYQVSVTKEKYNDKTANASVENINESNWQTDTLTNAMLCLEKKFVLKVENVVTIYFDFDKSYLKDRGMEQLDSIYSVLSENPTYTIQISGYTDGKGTVGYNKKLSDRRAKVCADYLIQKGLAPARITFESFGACCPVEMELINGRDNAEGRSKNRRALINISKE